MVRALGIDIGQRVTGFAVVDVSSEAEGIVLVKHLAPPDGAKRLRWMREMTLSLAQQFTVDVIGFEQASYPRNLSVFRRQAQLAGAIEEACEEYGYLWLPIAPATAKKRLTGSGRAKKPEMISAAEALTGYKVTEDEADALAVSLAVLDMVEEAT